MGKRRVRVPSVSSSAYFENFPLLTCISSFQMPPRRNVNNNDVPIETLIANAVNTAIAGLVPNLLEQLQQNNVNLQPGGITTMVTITLLLLSLIGLSASERKSQNRLVLQLHQLRRKTGLLISKSCLK